VQFGHQALAIGLVVRLVYRHYAKDVAKVPPRASVPSAAGAKSAVLAKGLAINVLLDYRDAAGIETKRAVTINQVLGTHHRDASLTLDHFLAFCHTRKAERSFRFERIISAADPATGEVMREFPAWLAKKAGHPERVRDIGHHR
jgi:hypothetical protein